MNNILLKCSKESCNNYRSIDTETDLCLVCEERRLAYLEKKMSKEKRKNELLKNDSFKSKEELTQYNYNVCIIKQCKKRVFMRDRCKKDYIEFMKTSTAAN